MSKYERLSSYGDVLGSGQIWREAESNYQSFVIDSSPPKYPYNNGVVGLDLFTNDIDPTLLDDLLSQDNKMDADTNILDKSIVSQIPVRFNVTTSFLAPNNLKWNG